MPEDWEKYAVKKTEEKQPSDEWEQFAVKKKGDTKSKNTTTNGVSLNSTSSSNSKSSNSNGYLGFPFFNILDPTNKFGNNKFMLIDENKKQAAKQMLGTPTTVPEQQKKQTVQTLEGKQKQEKSDILKKITGKDKFLPLTKQQIEAGKKAIGQGSSGPIIQQNKPLNTNDNITNISDAFKQKSDNTNTVLPNLATEIQAKREVEDLQRTQAEREKNNPFSTVNLADKYKKSAKQLSGNNDVEKLLNYGEISGYNKFVVDLLDENDKELYQVKLGMEDIWKSNKIYDAQLKSGAITQEQYDAVKKNNDKLLIDLNTAYVDKLKKRNSEVDEQIKEAQQQLAYGIEYIPFSGVYKKLTPQEAQDKKDKIKYLTGLKNDVLIDVNNPVKSLEKHSGYQQAEKEGLIPDNATNTQRLKIYSNILAYKANELAKELGYDTKDAKSLLGDNLLDANSRKMAWESFKSLIVGSNDKEKEFVKTMGELQAIAPIVVLNKNNLTLNEGYTSNIVSSFRKSVAPMFSRNQVATDADRSRLTNEAFAGAGISNDGVSPDYVAKQEDTKKESDSLGKIVARTTGDVLGIGVKIGVINPILELPLAGIEMTTGVPIFKGLNKALSTSKQAQAAESSTLAGLAETAKTAEELSQIKKAQKVLDIAKVVSEKIPNNFLTRTLYNTVKAGTVHEIQGEVNKELEGFANFGVGAVNNLIGMPINSLGNIAIKMFGKDAPMFILRVIDALKSGTAMTGTMAGMVTVNAAQNSNDFEAFKDVLNEHFGTGDKRLRFVAENFLLGLVMHAVNAPNISGGFKTLYEKMYSELSDTEKKKVDEFVSSVNEETNNFETETKDAVDIVSDENHTPITTEKEIKEQESLLGIAVAKESSSIIGKTDTELANKITKGGIESLTPEEKDYYTAQKENIDKLVAGNIKKTTTEEVANPSVEEAKEEAPKQESGRKSLDEIFKLKTEEKKATIESAVIEIGGKMYEGKNHAEAILKAKADGQDISKVDRQAEGKFKLSDGSIIDRAEAKKQFGQDRSELIIPQDENANQANKDYAKYKKDNEQEVPITPIKPVEQGQQNNDGTGLSETPKEEVEGVSGSALKDVKIRNIKSVDEYVEPKEEDIKDGNTFELIRGNVYDGKGGVGQTKNIQGIGLSDAMPSIFGDGLMQRSIKESESIISKATDRLKVVEAEIDRLGNKDNRTTKEFQELEKLFKEKKSLKNDLETQTKRVADYNKEKSEQDKIDKENADLGLVWLTNQKETARSYAEQLSKVPKAIIGERGDPKVNYDVVKVTPKKIFDLTKLTDENGGLYENNAKLEEIENILGIKLESLPDNPEYAYQLFRGRNAKKVVELLKEKGYDVVRLKEGNQDNFVLLNLKETAKATTQYTEAATPKDDSAIQSGGEQKLPDQKEVPIEQKQEVSDDKLSRLPKKKKDVENENNNIKKSDTGGEGENRNEVGIDKESNRRQAEAEHTAETKRLEAEVEKTNRQKATEKRKIAKEKLDAFRNKLGIISNPKEEANLLFDYHKALVVEAKEYIKEVGGDIHSWAKDIGEKVSYSLKTAWDEATGKIKPIDNADYFEQKVLFNDAIQYYKDKGLSYEEVKSRLDKNEVDYEEADLKDAWDGKEVPPGNFNDISEKELKDADNGEERQIGTKKAINDALYGEMGLKPLELPPRRSGQENLDAGKRMVDSGERNPVDLVDYLLSKKEDPNSAQISPNDEPVMLYYRMQLDAKGKELNNAISELQDKVNSNPQDEKSAMDLETVKQQQLLHYDEVERAINASQIGGNVWSKYGNARQTAVNEQGLLINSINRIKAIYGDDMPAKLSEELKVLQQKYDSLVSDNEKIQAEFIKKAEETHKAEVDKYIIEAYEKGKKDGSAGKATKTSKVKLEKAKAEIAEGLQDFLQAVGGLNMAAGNVMPSITKALKKIGNGLIKAGEATAENVFDKIVEYIEKNTGKKPDIENYRGEFEKKEEKKAKISRKRVKQAIENGAVTVDDVVQDIQKDFPDMTEREIKEDITNYGKTKESSQEPDDVATRKVIRIAKYDLILEDIENGKRPPRTGLQRDNLDVEERAKLKEIREGLKKLKPSDEDLSKKLKTSQDAIETRLKNRIEDLKRQIDAGKKDTRIIKPISTPDIEKLRDEVKKLEDDLDEVVSKNRHSDTLQELKDNAEISGNTTISKADVDNGLISDLVQAHIEKGTPINEVQKTIFDELKAIFPDTTEAQVRDAILKQGEFGSGKKTRTDLQNQVSELKKQLNYNKKIEDLQNGIEKETKAKGAQSDEVKALQKQLADAKKESVNKFPNLSSVELERQIKTNQSKIDKGDYFKVPFVKKKWLSDERWIQNNQRLTNLKNKLREHVKDAMESEKSLYMRFLDAINRWGRRVIFFGSNAVYTKLASAAMLGSFAHRIPEQLTGLGYKKLFPRLGNISPESSYNIEAEKKFYEEFLNPKKFIKNTWDIAKTGQTELSKELGHHSNKYHIPIVDLFAADSHIMIKDPVKRATFEATFLNHLKFYSDNNVDYSHPLIMESARQAAYKAAEYEIFQDSGSITKNNAINIGKYFNEIEKNAIIENKSEVTFEKIGGNLKYTIPFLKNFFIPINTVPSNIVRRVFLPFKIPYLLVKAMSESSKIKKGISTLSTEEADLIFRQLKKGTIGAAYWTLGFCIAGQFAGGLYTRFYPDKKRKKGIAKSNELDFLGMDINHNIQHTPQLTALQMGATARIVYSHYVDDKDANAFRATMTATTALGGSAIDQMPTPRFTKDALNAASNPYDYERFKANLVRRVGYVKGMNLLKMMGYGDGYNNEDGR